ncbi:GntR family transcriptional regulator [Tepidamorphus gemmatus]|uniref:GntR family transcriptional regulator n=1 Tax=Tepidamorphus gemmatus TaxID=747076 RepID=A0A4R3MHG1_9HYPH|nr:GntR family transcriptional regulator [Tepidamorphus gemmatus]TCT13465.1 GntR family transcriptional regulator [Tepidamorphus gemmatus]
MAGTTVRRFDLPDASPISRETLQDEVYRRLIDLILDGAIAPGQLVTIQGLADTFGTSAMPVREALKRLAAANVLTVVSGRSIGIPPLSAARLDDLHRVRREIEPLAAGWAVAGMDASRLAGLRGHLAEMTRAVAEGDAKTFLRANRAFHFGIYSVAGSPTLDRIIESLWLQISPYFNLLGKAGAMPVTNTEHEALMRALEAGDVAGVRDSLVRDIDIGCGVIRKLLQ